MGGVIALVIVLIILASISIFGFRTFFIARKNQIILKKIDVGEEELIREMLRKNIKKCDIDKEFSLFFGIGGIISFSITLLLLLDYLCRF